MKLQNQVCSLELAKKLKELGVKQISIFFWVETDRNPKTAKVTLKRHAKKIISWHRQIYSAHTVAELGEMLPTRYKKSVYHTKNIPSNNDYKHDFIISWGKSIRPKKPVVGEVFQGGTETYYYCSSFTSSGSPHHVQEAAVRFEANTEADARAKCLIYLIENNLITL